MEELNKLLQEIGISKVRLAKYLGVSRQMLYNYLAEEKISDWPNEKEMKLTALLGIENSEDIKDIKVDGEYIIEVEARLNEAVRELSGKNIASDLKGFNKKEQVLLNDIFNLLKERLSSDKSKEIYDAYRYLHVFIQALDNTKEIKYILGYIGKSLGAVDPYEFKFNENQQLIFESIMFHAMTLYNNGGASKRKLAEVHEKFVQELEQKKEEKLSRTEELTNVTVQALKELGYKTITNENSTEVLTRIAEIESRQIV